MFMCDAAYWEMREELALMRTSETEWDNAEAAEIGFCHPERAWVLTDRDVWHQNPFYTGPYVPHPESYETDLTDEERAIAERESVTPYAAEIRNQQAEYEADDIPF